MKKSPRLILSFLPQFASLFFLTGCVEDEEAKIEDLEGEMKLLAIDQESATEFVTKAKAELAGYEKAHLDLAKSEELREKLKKVTEELEVVTSQSDELKASLETSNAEFEGYRADYRTKVRKEIIGKEVDLSTTKGEGFESVRVLSATPLGLRIYMSSGPQSVRVSELPIALKERLQMDDEEVEAYHAKQASDAELRAAKYEEWKKGLAERKKETAQSAIVKRLADIQNEVENLEKLINTRINKIKDLKSRASQWERNWAKENNPKRRAKAEKYSQYYRDQAQLVTDENSNTWLVIFRLRAEMEDLKELKKPGK